METRDIFEQMASRYDTQERIDNANIIAAEIRRTVTDTQGKSALDYGCGTGLVGLQLLNMFDSLLFVDASAQMIEQVRRKLALLGADAKTLCADLAADLPPDIAVDYILLSQVLLHVRDYERLLRRLVSLLNPGGHLVIVDFDTNDRIETDQVHHGFDQAALSELLHTIGFSAVSSHTFYHGEKMFAKQDASMFILDAEL